MTRCLVHICRDGNLVERSKVERTQRFGGGSLPFVRVTLVICSFSCLLFVCFFFVLVIYIYIVVAFFLYFFVLCGQMPLCFYSIRSSATMLISKELHLTHKTKWQQQQQQKLWGLDQQLTVAKCCHTWVHRRRRMTEAYKDLIRLWL